MSKIQITFRRDSQHITSDEYILELDKESDYIKKYPSDNGVLDITAGHVSYVAKNICEEKIEMVVFNNENEAQLSYPPDRIIDYQWIGRNHLPPQFVDDTIKMLSPVRGVLQVRYKTCYDLIETDIDPDVTALLSVTSDDRYGSMVIRGSEVRERKPVYLTVRDACSKMVIANARVFLDDVFIGLTDNNGRINLGELQTEKRYNIKVVAEGYQPTDEDTIANDYFFLS